MKWVAPVITVLAAHLLLGGIVSTLARQPGAELELQRTSQARLEDECSAVWATLSVDATAGGREVGREELVELVQAATGVAVDLRGWERLTVTPGADWRAEASVERDGLSWRVRLLHSPGMREWTIATESPR